MPQSRQAEVVPDTPSLFLAEVERHHQPGPYATLVADARNNGIEYSRIWDLFAYQNDITAHMGRFTQGVLRQPSSISPGMRELVAAYTSHLNRCGFCTQAHAHAAATLLEDERLLSAVALVAVDVFQVLEDLESSPLARRDKALLRFVAKLTLHLADVTRADVALLTSEGWDDEAVYFVVTTCALFNFYNRWITGLGVPQMSEPAHRAQGQVLAARGYTRS